jgi:mechanosensitive ion channel-like protein
MLAIEWEQGLNDAWARIATFVPKLLGFFAILIIGYFLAKALARAADAILERVGFDGWVERGSLKTAMERGKFDPSDIVAVIVFWAIFLIALQLAFGIFGDNPVSDLITGIIAYLPNVLVAVIILVIAAAVAKVVTDILTATLGAVHGGQWMARGAGVAILVIGVFAALNQLQIAPEIVNGLYYAILVAIVGSAIVAVGGGGIRTMQRYWERTTETLERTGSEIKRNADPEVGRMAAQQRMEEERARMQAAREPEQQPEEVDLREETVPTAPRPDRP